MANRISYEGKLYIDYDEGIIEFKQADYTMLRITHLKKPIPPGVTIDMVALDKLTSYTSME